MNALDVTSDHPGGHQHLRPVPGAVHDLVAHVATSPVRASFVSVETLRASWQSALDAAEDALRHAGFCLPAEEVRARAAGLVAEREPTESLLKGLARDRHENADFVRLVPRTDARYLLGLPPVVSACVFNVDGVLIGSAAIHAAAWAETFDEFISKRIEATGGHFPPFNPRDDYRRYMHGKPRLDGVRAFLASRGVSLPEGSDTDPPGTETVHGLANRKNQALLRRLEHDGVDAFGGAIRYLEIARNGRMPYAVVSASANTGAILERAGLASLIAHAVDGNTAIALGLRPRPAPDILLAACRTLGASPARVAVFETSPTGVAVARAAGFAFVVGVDAGGGQAAALRAEGADLVITGLSEILDRTLAK